MADLKISQLNAITVLTPATDVLPVVDSGGVTKKITTNQILGSGGTATLASATITGDLTVDTSTLKVDSTNDRVLIGTLTALGSAKLSILGKTQADTSVAGDVIGNFNNTSATGYGLRIGGGSATGGYALSVNNNAGSEFHQISGTGIATWSNVGGVASTAMTLNSVGLGVGTVPANGIKLASYVTTAGVPATSGTTQSAGSLRIGAASTAGVMDMGTNGSYSWIQPCNATNLATNYDLVLNQNGGNVGIGVTSPTYKLQTTVASGANRNIFAAQIAGASNGFEVLWNHATTTLRIVLSNIPTSAAGLASGTLWNDSGTIKIA